VDRKRFPKALAATPSIEAKHPALRRLARKAVGNEKRALAAVKKLNAFVFGYLKKSLSTNLDSALAIARARAGDCTEHARLMVALCRAIGLPAREVGGVTWVPDLGGFGYHAWTEVWVGRWIAVDPSWNEVPANATHIHMGGPDDVQWIGTLGDLEIDVLGMETDPKR
jgi:transglutaminase-like putative cysteine protease